MNEQPAEALLSDVFGHDRFRGCQRDVIDRLLNGQHAMVVMPTGMGKSLCYQIPAIMRRQSSQDLTLVLSPLIALMRDQVDALKERGVDAALINSSLDAQTRRDRYQSLRDGQYTILYVTPERFRNAEFLDCLRHRSVRLLAVDEAHCVSQWGHDFRPDYSRLAEIRNLVGDPPTIALTATATKPCREDIYQQLGLRDTDIKLFHQGIDRPNLTMDVHPVIDESEKLEALRSALRDPEHAHGRVIVYFSLIKTLQRFSDALFADRLDHVCYHGDLDRQTRRAVQDAFMKGDADLALATNAFGMGIDRADIRMVIHAETPGSIESYYQEIGRAGRDGLPSRCLWLYDQADLMTQMQFIEWSHPDADFYHRLYETLRDHRDQCEAFGWDWLSRRLQRLSRHDHRLSTAVGMLERYGVVAGPRPPECFRVVDRLPDAFRDDQRLDDRKKRAQERLYEMVKLSACPAEQRQEFLNRYFAG